MEVNQLYQFVLLIVLVGMIMGTGVLILGNFSVSTGITNQSSAALNSTIDAISPIASTWIPLIVTIAVLAIVLTLVIRSFGGGMR